MRRHCRSHFRFASAVPSACLDDTNLPIRFVAESAGFSSTRRLRAAFARLYGNRSRLSEKGRLRRGKMELTKPDENER